MSNDVLYGADCEARIGIMADKDTLPTAWYNFEFNSLNLNPTRTLVQRPRLGAARANVLDPLKPRLGLERHAADLVVDADTLIFPRLMRMLLGAPATTGAGPYTHVWSSGAKTEVYCAIAVRAGTDKVWLLKAVSLGTISSSWGGVNAQDFDIQMQLMAISRTREDDWPSGTVTAVTTPAPILRGALLIDGTAADQVVSAGFTWDRDLQADAYANTSGTADRNVSYLRPGPAPQHSGQTTIRAHGTAYDVLADALTEFSAESRLLGVTSGHMIKFAHPQSSLTQPPIQVGEGVIERSLSWSGHQSSTVPASKITVINAVSGYA